MTQSIILGAVPAGTGLQVRTDINTGVQALASQNSGASSPTQTYPYMLWRRTTDRDLFIRNSGNSAWDTIEHYTTTNPAVGDDVNDGYVVGCFWFNTTTKALFICTNNAVGAAVWPEIVSGGGGGGVTTVFGRGGAVLANTGDYNAGQITETGGAKIMTSAERTKLAAINTYWAARTAADPAAHVKNTSIGGHDLRYLTLYHGALGAINAVNNADYSAAQLARYDDVVLGYGLQAPGHADYASTISVISKAKVINPNLMIWGNIDAGVSGGTSHNHSTGTLQTHVDQWVTAGATGIFVDNFGYDFAVTRARQNTIINYIHGKPLGAMVFAVTMADALGSAVNATYNATGVATVLDSRDACMFRWAFNSDLIATPHFDTFSAMKQRGDDARTYRGSLGVRMYGANIISYTGRGQTDLDNYRGIAESLAHIWRLDGFGVSLALYSASGTDLNQLRPYHAKVIPQPGGRKTAIYKVNAGNTEIEAADLGIVVHYESGQYTWTAPTHSIGTTGSGGAGTAGDSGLIPATVQSTNGNAANAELVLLKGAVSDISLLVVATGRHRQDFKNLTAQTVIFTASETILDYAGGFGLEAGGAVSFGRDPDNNSWIVL